MQLASIILAVAAAVAAVAAQETPAPVVATSTMPDGNAKVTLPPDTTAPGATPAAAGAGAAPASGGGVGVAAYKASPTTDAYHMAPVRVVHARVQSDSPILVEGQLVSSFGKGKLDAGYLSSLDSVNTASVEGALMYVQAETINVATRAAKERCVRKTKVANVVFYEILIAQTNETIAQFQDDWSTPEYGPMLAFDGGKCSATEGDKLPAECYQFNGQKDQPNVGPFVGGTNKELSDRAPYPGNYWFSFPNTCPTESWADKTADCRKTTRMGLCPVGVAPNGVDCTFAYSILGWVPIDDVVGITSFANSATGKSFTNFTQWCEASEDNVEFSYDLASKTVKTALPFWEKPLDTDANANRTQVMLDTYAALLTKGSSQVSPAVAKAFRALPKPEELAKTNPPCYKTVAKCGSGNGCKRTGYSQLCVECKAGEKCPTSDGTFTFPKLVKAFTTLPAEETKTNLTPAPEGVNDDKSVTGGNAAGGKANGTTTDKTGSAAATVSVAFATAAASVLLALAL